MRVYSCRQSDGSRTTGREGGGGEVLRGDLWNSAKPSSFKRIPRIARIHRTSVVRACSIPFYGQPAPAEPARPSARSSYCFPLDFFRFVFILFFFFFTQKQYSSELFISFQSQVGCVLFTWTVFNLKTERRKTRAPDIFAFRSGANRILRRTNSTARIPPGESCAT